MTDRIDEAIDATEITQKLETSMLDLQKAQSDVIAAKEGKDIQESTNAANLEAANVELILARLDLQQYEEGTFPQLLDEARRNLEMSKISVRQKEQDLAQSQALFSKGFVNAAVPDDVGHARDLVRGVQVENLRNRAGRRQACDR